jgi:hypothetical protein
MIMFCSLFPWFRLWRTVFHDWANWYLGEYCRAELLPPASHLVGWHIRRCEVCAAELAIEQELFAGGKTRRKSVQPR